MEHIERMRALRRQVDIIIEQTETLTSLKKHAGSLIEMTIYVNPIGDHPTRERRLAVPITELHALVQRRIDDAEAELRKLGMVAPAHPGLASFARTPAVREDTPSDTDTTPSEESP